MTALTLAAAWLLSGLPIVAFFHAAKIQRINSVLRHPDPDTGPAAAQHDNPMVNEQLDLCQIGTVTE